jgi:release factor glutamine methyltransferase
VTAESPASASAQAAAAAGHLADAGVDSPRHDADVLLAAVLGVARAELGRTPAATGADLARFEHNVERRAARVPLQHLTGVAGFRYLDLEVGPGVFVPRPETEVVAGAAIDEARRLDEAGIVPLVVDLCTGSGAVALAVATEVPRARVVAIEMSPDANAYAERNAARLAPAVDVRLGDMATAADDLAGAVQVVVANPPYIPMAAYESVPVEVRDHDPALALWSGVDGLDDIRVVRDVGARLLVDGGLVLCEHADVQGGAAVAAFAEGGQWGDVRDHRDLAGRDRFIAARRVRRRSGSAGTMSS